MAFRERTQSKTPLPNPAITAITGGDLKGRLNTKQAAINTIKVTDNNAVTLFMCLDITSAVEASLLVAMLFYPFFAVGLPLLHQENRAL